MRNQFIGSMPPSSFLKEFLPRLEQEPALPRGYHTLFANLEVGDGFEERFVQMVETAGLCPGLVLIDTHESYDAKYKRAPDISVYKDVHDQSNTDFRLMEFHIERKTLHQDPFDDLPPRAKKALRDKHVFEHNTSKSNHSRGQIASYTAAQFNSQARTFSFSIIFIDQFVRLIRWDRAGAVVTSRFNWKNKPRDLALFLWRFARSSDSVRGYDTSVSIPTEDEIRRAKVALKQRALEVAMAQGGTEKDILKPPYSSDETFQKFRVVDDGPNPKEHFFVASSPQWCTNSPTGRGTKGYEALDVDTGKVVYLKDSWRYIAEGYEKEGDTYRHLIDSKVERIPRLVCASDVEGHETRTHEFLGKRWCCRTSAVKHHGHHRLVLADLGRPLSQYISTKELSQVMSDAIEAHQQAYDAKVLHQDISGGNILITNEGRGLLIDWDLSRRQVDNAPVARLRTRTGTWQFMSCARLRNQGKHIHYFWHDLESFLHVYLYHTILYQASKIPEEDYIRIIPQFENFFDEFIAALTGPDIGGELKLAYFQPSTTCFPQDTLSKFLNKLVVDIISDLRHLFIPIYALRAASDRYLAATLPSVKEAQESLTSSKLLLGIFKSKFPEKGWTDDRSDGLFGKPPVIKNAKHFSKRKGGDAELDDNKGGRKKKSRQSQNVSREASTLIFSTIDEASDVFN